ncbi:MAG: ABC transporter permease [Gammaproteobacteria bacterium]|nr:ABC transporter permease [Gammaproteobacteria bacterium]
MWFLALKQLLARKRQTLFVIGGVLLGTAAYVLISGIMLGFQGYLITKLIDNDGHIHIAAKEENITRYSLDEALFGGQVLVDWKKFPSGRRDHAKIEHPSGWFELLDNDPRVLAYSPQINVQTLAQRGVISISARVVGVDPTKQERVTNINSYIQNGRLSDIGKAGNRIILGKQLMLKLGANVNENITLSTGKGAALSFRVVNYFETGTRAVDQGVIYAALADAQKLNRTPSQITDISVKLADVTEAKNVANGYARFSTDYVQSWDEENQSVFSVFRMQTAIRYIMSLSILLVAAFGIYNILNVIVTQKRKEVGILRSMGFTGQDVSRLFLYQGIVFGVFGGVFGVIIGYGACRLAGTYQIGDPLGTGISSLVVSYDIQIYLNALALAIGASVVAGWVPARGAGKLNPIDIIRSDG